MISCDPTDFPETAGAVAGRAMLVKATRPVRLECVVRGYLFGGGWAEYNERGTVGGFAVPAGLRQAEQLAGAVVHADDEGRVGPRPPGDRRRSASSSSAPTSTSSCANCRCVCTTFGARHARERGVILADTKFEFGERDGEILVIDEMMTPDSSRYWPADEYAPGTSPPSFDKQYVRDFMDATGWNHEPPAPHLPPEVDREHACEVHRGLRAAHRRELRHWYAPDD